VHKTIPNYLGIIFYHFKQQHPIPKNVSERITPTAPLGNMDINNIPKAKDTNITPNNFVRKHITFTHILVSLYYMICVIN
jgi:hypothetical protein